MPPDWSGGIFRQNMTKELIIKYFNNRCTEEELNEVLQWIKNNSENDEDKNQAFDIWKNYQPKDDRMDDEKFSALFDKIQQKIDTASNRATEQKKTSFLIFTTWLTRAAAMLLIPVLAFLFYTLSERKSDLKMTASMTVDSMEVIAPVGSRTVIHLPDGSEVHLNYGSTLKYPQVFSGQTREVVLTGEGYFDVEHNPDKPFVVSAGIIDVKAVGTKFNVQSYPYDDAISTTLVEGKVLLEKQLPGKPGEHIGAMKPGQHVNYNYKTGEIITSIGDVEKYIAWKDGKMVFEDTPITQIANKLSRMFNVDIEVDKNIKDYYYTVTFIDEPLFQILD